MGEMPSGKMQWKSIQKACTGYEGYQTIEIEYKISGGTKDGVQFSGSSRTAYLPDNLDGKISLTLLAEAFRRKLTFKVGTSISTG